MRFNFEGPTVNGIVSGWPRVLLRLEGLAVLIVVACLCMAGRELVAVRHPVFAPGLSMIGYVGGGRRGAALYNLAHWYVLPLACLAWGASSNAPQVLAVGLVWVAHIGFDRSLGYGLKYAEGFGVSHLGQMGKAKDIA